MPDAVSGAHVGITAGNTVGGIDPNSGMSFSNPTETTYGGLTGDQQTSLGVTAFGVGVGALAIAEGGTASGTLAVAGAVYGGSDALSAAAAGAVYGGSDTHALGVGMTNGDVGMATSPGQSGNDYGGGGAGYGDGGDGGMGAAAAMMKTAH